MIELDCSRPMKDSLVRFGVAMESTLVDQIDALAAARGSSRSELLRDLARAELSRLRVDRPAPAFAAVTLVYNHHVRELAERLTSLQHDLGDQVRSTMHVHLTHQHCMEVIVMRGRSDELRGATDRMLGARGVLHGGAEYVAESMLSQESDGHRHGSRGDDDHGPHDHPPSRPHSSPRSRMSRSRGTTSRKPKSG